MSTQSVHGVQIPSGLLVNGRWVPGRGPRLDTINPATEEVITTIDTASSEDVDDAVKSARNAFENTWGTNVSAQRRGQLVYALAGEIERRLDDLATLECVDSGKPISWSRIDMEDAVACFKYFAGLADKVQGSVIELDDQSKYATTRREPIGVVAQIVPWNYPILMMTWKVAPALAAGCSIVFKPAEQTPLSTLLFATFFEKVGFPQGVFNLVNGLGRITGAALSTHMDVDKIAFTGSTVTGRQIAISAAQSNLKSVTLELGGKSPDIVFESANLREAAKWAAWGTFENMGQSCSAGTRILVQKSIYDDFVPLFVQAVRAIVVGPPEGKDTFQGPQVSDLQFDKIMSFIEQGKTCGATLLTGGKRWGDKGYFIEPTVFGDVTMGMTIAQEEIFGPVASLIKFADEEEAVTIANDTTYGLAAAIHSTSYPQVNKVARRLKAGTVWINQYVFLSHAVPFGGFKQSGWGRELGIEGLEPYLITKSVHHYYGEDFEWPIKC